VKIRDIRLSRIEPFGTRDTASAFGTVLKNSGRLATLVVTIHCAAQPIIIKHSCSRHTLCPASIICWSSHPSHSLSNVICHLIRFTDHHHWGHFNLVGASSSHQYDHTISLHGWPKLHIHQSHNESTTNSNWLQQMYWIWC